MRVSPQCPPDFFAAHHTAVRDGAALTSFPTPPGRHALPDCIAPAETETTTWTRNDPLIQAVVQSYRVSKMQGDRRTAKQMLSLLLTIEGATQSEVMELCSYTDPVGQPGQDVWVLASVHGPSKGCKKVRGKLVSVDAAHGHCIVDVGAQQQQVALNLVISTRTVVCTFHQIRAALNHAAVRYPGAPVPRMVRMLERLDPARAQFFADWLAHEDVSEHVEASGRSKGTCPALSSCLSCSRVCWPIVSHYLCPARLIAPL